MKVKVISQYTNWGRCKAHGQDIFYYCEGIDCKTKRLCCKQCRRKQHTEHLTSSCQDKKRQIARNISALQRLKKQQAQYSALQILSILNNISKVKENFALCMQLVNKIETSELLVYCEGLTYPPEIIQNHLNFSNLNDNTIEELIRVSRKWKGYDLSSLNLNKHTQHLSQQVDRICQKATENINYLANYIKELIQYTNSPMEKIEQWNKKNNKLENQMNELISDIRQNAQKNSQIISFIKEPESESIEQINLSKKDWIDSMVIQKLQNNLNNLRNVKKIDLSENRITDGGLERVFEIFENQFPQLSILNLNGNNLGNKALQLIINAKVPKLTRLFIMDNQITDQMLLFELYSKNQGMKIDYT